MIKLAEIAVRFGNTEQIERIGEIPVNFFGFFPEVFFRFFAPINLMNQGLMRFFEVRSDKVGKSNIKRRRAG